MNAEKANKLVSLHCNSLNCSQRAAIFAKRLECGQLAAAIDRLRRS